MLRIYLPSSTSLKLCSDIPTVDFVDTRTFVTVFMSRHLGPNIWVLANGSKIICQPLGHLLGPGSSHMGLGIWVFPMSDLIFMYLVLKKKKSTKTTPSDRVPYSGRAPKYFHEKKLKIKMNPAFEMNRANQFKMDSHEVAEYRCQRIPHSFIIELSIL